MKLSTLSSDSAHECDTALPIHPGFLAALGSTMPRDWQLTGRPHPEATPQPVAITGDHFTVGRHPENNLSIQNDTVSGRHAELLWINEELFVRDLNSTNGTLLNGHRVRTMAALQEGDILHFGNAMYTVSSPDDLAPTTTVVANSEGDAIAQILFSRLLSDAGVTPHLQPIVRFADETHVGYESLARSQFVGLETPDKMFRVAAQHSAEIQLSHVCRMEGARAMRHVHPAMCCYLNTHPAELDTASLIESIQQLRTDYPDTPMMLEIHESAVASIDLLKRLRHLLNSLNIGLAYDDFGAGQTRLMELVEVPPDVVKFDIKFIRGLPFASDQRISTTKSIIRMVKDLGALTLAEGVESREEAAVCRECGFELAQGYLFGRAELPRHWARR